MVLAPLAAAATLAGSHYAYRDETLAVRSGTICLTPKAVRSGHVAAWIGAVDGDGRRWLQAGVAAFPDGGPLAYVESEDRRVYLNDGPCHTVQLEEHGSVWHVVIDGVRSWAVRLAGARTLFTGESLEGSEPNDYSFTLGPLSG